MTSIAPTVVYPSLISRACATLDESPMFKDAPDGYLRVILRIIKKINLKRLSAPILASRATLAEESGKSVETVHRVVRWLEEHGLVQREQRGHSAWYRCADASVGALCDGVCSHLARLAQRQRVFGPN